MQLLTRKLIKRFYKPEYFFRPKKLLDRVCYSMFPPQPVMQKIKLSWGDSLIANPQQTIGRSLFTFGVYDLALSELIYRLVRPGDLVIDVGANIGYTSLLMLNRLKEKGELISFEPLPSLFSILSENIKSTNTTIAKLNELALSDSSGDAILTLPLNFATNDGIATLSEGIEGEKIQIKTKRLDDLNLNRSVRLLKLDAEGHELKILKGASEMLNKDLFEYIIYEDLQGSKGETTQFLKENGYTIHKLVKKFRGLKLHHPDFIDHYSYEPENFLATKDKHIEKKINSTSQWQIFKEK